MIEHFNSWFFGSGGYEFIGGFLELTLVVVTIMTVVFYVGNRE